MSPQLRWCWWHGMCQPIMVQLVSPTGMVEMTKVEKRDYQVKRLKYHGCGTIEVPTLPILGLILWFLSLFVSPIANPCRFHRSYVSTSGRKNPIFCWKNSYIYSWYFWCSLLKALFTRWPTQLSVTSSKCRIPSSPMKEIRSIMPVLVPHVVMPFLNPDVANATQNITKVCQLWNQFCSSNIACVPQRVVGWKSK